MVKFIVALGAYDEESGSDASSPRHPAGYTSKLIATREEQTEKSNEERLSNHVR
jgi:hypothetical protein